MDFLIGGDIPVHRLGFGTLRLVETEYRRAKVTRTEARALLQRAIELGVNLIDTADSYGPATAEELIAEALFPYPQDLVIATKGGLVQDRAGGWFRDGRPEYLRRAVEQSLRRLRLERIDLYQLHAVDPRVRIEESVGALAELKARGMIRHIGLSNVNVVELERARLVAGVASVQNRYSVVDRSSDPVVDICQREGIGFLPWFPLGGGSLVRRGGKVEAVAARLGATRAQVALAWLLKRSPVVLAIPGTSSLAHLEENMAAATLDLSDADFDLLSG